MELHELVKVLEYQGVHTKVVSLRTGEESSVSWSTFFPVMWKTRCGCVEGLCRCELEYPVSRGICGMSLLCY